MSKQVRVLQLKGGIAVKITMTKKRYKVAILLPNKKEQKEIKIRNRQVNLYVKLMKKTNEPMVIELQGDYKKDSYGQICIDNWSKIKFLEDDYEGHISLNPNCYIPANVLKKVKVYWQEYYKNAKLLINTPYPTGKTSTASKYTNYAHNNAGKPFGGGSVSPK